MSEQVGSIHYDLTLKDNEFKGKIKSVDSEVSGLSKTFDNMTETSKKLVVGLGALWAASGVFIKKAAETAARTETLGVVLESVAKATGNSIDLIREQEQAMKKQGIATQEARQILTLFMQSQLEVADASKIARVAQDLAVISEQNSSQAAQTLTEAISTQSAMLLRQYGITKTSNQIFDEYAQTVGKAGSDLDNLEKKQAFVNIIMEEGQKVAGTYEASMETVGKKIGSLDRYFQEAYNTIGVLFLPVVGQMVDALTEGLKQINPENIEKLTKIVYENKDALIALTIGITAMLVPAFVSWTIAAGEAAVATLVAALPLIALGAAVAAVAYVIIKNWDWIVEQTNVLVAAFKALPERIKSALSGLANIISKPFSDAWNKIKGILDNIRGGLDKINPFHRESPSLVDNVKMGVAEIARQYGKLGDIVFPSILPSDMATATSMTNQSIAINIDRVNDMQDVQMISRELGFRAGLQPGMEVI